MSAGLLHWARDPASPSTALPACIKARITVRGDRAVHPGMGAQAKVMLAVINVL